MEKVLKFARNLEMTYKQFKENTLTNRFFKYSDILDLINKKRGKPWFEVTTAGTSVEGRDIFVIKAGNGKKKVFLWSQMHGDEPTATAAIFDILNFLSQQQVFNNEIEIILEKLELFFLPMVNPDGAQVFKRRNALDIDLNRDASRLSANETVMLKKLRDEINPEYGFNLHDQEIYYSAGANAFPATISFLAPSFNKEKEIDEKRMKSIHQILLMNKVLEQFIPGCIGRYNDEFMPTAFGDNMQRWGTSTILIESGGYFNDPEKQIARKMNFIAILSSLLSLAMDDTIHQFEKADYFQIPENKKEKYFDLIIRNAWMERNNIAYKIDVGIRNKEEYFNRFRNFTSIPYIADLGDLSHFFAYHEIDATGLYIKNEGSDVQTYLFLNQEAQFILMDSTGKKIHQIEKGGVKSFHS